MNDSNSADKEPGHWQASSSGDTDGSSRPRRELLLVGGLLGIVGLLLVGLAALQGTGVFQSSRPQVASANVEVTTLKPASSGRTNCAEIGASDLRSPAEGLWYQTNCTVSVSTQSNAVSTNCNRSALDASFTPIAPGLFISRLTSGSLGFLWYQSSDTCFDLVSTRVVTAVCGDQTVSFRQGSRSGCDGHGGVLAWVNNR